MTNKTVIIGIILTLFILVLTSAHYPGDTITVEHNLGTDNLIHMIVGNSSELTVLPNVTINSTHIQVYFPTDMPPDSFTIIFIDNSTQEVYIEVPVYRRSSGGTETIYIQNETVLEVPTYVDREVIVLNNTRDEIFITKDDLDQQYPTIMDKLYKVLIWMAIILIILGSILFYFVRRKMKGGKKIMEEDVNGEMYEEETGEKEDNKDDNDEEDLGLDNE